MHLSVDYGISLLQNYLLPACAKDVCANGDCFLFCLENYINSHIKKGVQQ